MRMVSNESGNKKKRFAGGLNAGMDLRDAQRGVKTAKELIQLGGNYRLFFPLMNGEANLMTANVPGRKLHAKRLKRSFLPLEDFEVDEYNHIFDNSEFKKFARIAKIIHKAEAECEKAEAEREAEATAEKTGEPVDRRSLDKAINDIQLTYFGDPDAKPTPVYATENPMIGPVVVEMATEALVVPLNANGDPDWDKADVMTVSISKTKAEQIAVLLRNKDYCRPEDGFLEVGYSFVGKDRTAAGRAAVYQGISKEISLKYKPELTELWEAKAAMAISKLAKDSDAIEARCPAFNGKTTGEEVIKNFMKFISTRKLIVASIDLKDDDVKRNIGLLVEMGIGENMPKIHEQMIALLQEQKANEEVESEDEVKHLLNNDDDGNVTAAAANSSSLNELLEASDGDLGAVMGTNEADTTESFEGDDLGDL